MFRNVRKKTFIFLRINVKNWFPVKEEMCRFRMLTKMLCEVKQKFFGRVGATKFCRANAPKKIEVSFLWLQKQKRLLFYQFLGEPRRTK